LLHWWHVRIYHDGGQKNWKIAYVILLVVMAVIALINYRLLMRMERDANEDVKKLQIKK